VWSVGKCAGLCSEHGRWRLLQLVLDLLDEVVRLVIIPGNDLIFLLGGQATLTKDDDAESGILVAASSIDESLKKAVGLGEEGLSSLLGSGVGANTVEDVDSGKVATLCKQVHAGHSSSLDVAGDGDSTHCLAGLVSDHAEKVEESGSVVEAQSVTVQDHTGLTGKLDYCGQYVW